MDIDSDGSVDLDDKKGKKKRTSGPRQMPWHRMLKALKRLGYDDSGDFDQAQFSAKIQEYAAEVAQKWNEANGEIEFDVEEPNKLTKRKASGKLMSTHDDVIVIAPGETKFITVEIRNEGKKAWKEGTLIGLAKKQKKTPKQKKGDTTPVVPAVPLEDDTLLVRSLAPNTGDSYNVPLRMMANIPADNERVFNVNLTLYVDDKKKHFG